MLAILLAAPVMSSFGVERSAGLPTGKSEPSVGLAVGGAAPPRSNAPSCTNCVIANISLPGGGGPVGITYDPSNHDMYVVDRYGNCVTVVNGTTSAIIKTIGVGTDPYFAAYDPLDREVYVTNHLSGNVSVINGTTNTVVTSLAVNQVTNPEGIAYIAQDQSLWVGGYTNGVQLVNATTNAISAAVFGNPAIGFSYDPLNQKVYGAGGQLNQVPVANVSNPYRPLIINVPTGPQAVTYDPALQSVILDSAYPGKISIVNTTRETLVDNISTGQAQGSVYDPLNGEVYVANGPSANVTVLSGLLPVGSIPIVATNPWLEDPVLDPMTGDIWVSDLNWNEVRVISPGATPPFSATAMVAPLSGRAPLLVWFNASAGGGAPPYTFRWHFGDGTYGSGFSIQHTYASSGTFGSVVWENDSMGHSVVRWFNITVTGGGPTITSVSVLPPSSTILTGASQSFTASPSCNGGPCSAGTTFAWTISRGLGTFNATSGSVVQFTAGSSAGTTYLFANATLNGVTVQSVPVPITITSSGSGTPRYTVTFRDQPSGCPMTFNGSAQANVSSGTFLQGNYTAFAPGCAGYVFYAWSWGFLTSKGFTGGQSMGDPDTIDVLGNGTVAAIYWSLTGPPPKYALQFVVSPGGCGPISFNGTSQANGTSASFLALSYTAHAPACAGHPFRAWTDAFPSQRVIYIGTWVNISVGAAGTLFANYTSAGPPPPLTISLTANSTSLTAGDSATLTPTVSGGVPPYSCLWSLNGTNRSQTGCGAASLAFARPGTYTYRVWATDSAYSVAGSNSVAITVSARPSPLPLVAFGNGTIAGYPGACGEGAIPGVLENVTFTGSARGGVPPYSFSWTFGDGSPKANGRNVTHGYATLGDQNGTLTVTDGAGTSSSVVVPVVGPKDPAFSCPSQSGHLPPTVFFGLTVAGFLVLVVLPAAVLAVLVPLVLLWRQRRDRGPPPPEPGPSAPGCFADPRPPQGSSSTSPPPPLR